MYCAILQYDTIHTMYRTIHEHVRHISTIQYFFTRYDTYQVL